MTSKIRARVRDRVMFRVRLRVFALIAKRDEKRNIYKQFLQFFVENLFA